MTDRPPGEREERSPDAGAERFSQQQQQEQQLAGLLPEVQFEAPISTIAWPTLMASRPPLAMGRMSSWSTLRSDSSRENSMVFPFVVKNIGLAPDALAGSPG